MKTQNLSSLLKTFSTNSISHSTPKEIVYFKTYSEAELKAFGASDELINSFFTKSGSSYSLKSNKTIEEFAYFSFFIGNITAEGLAMMAQEEYSSNISQILAGLLSTVQYSDNGKVFTYKYKSVNVLNLATVKEKSMTYMNSWSETLKIDVFNVLKTAFNQSVFDNAVAQSQELTIMELSAKAKPETSLPSNSMSNLFCKLMKAKIEYFFLLNEGKTFTIENPSQKILICKDRIERSVLSYLNSKYQFSIIINKGVDVYDLLSFFKNELPVDSVLYKKIYSYISSLQYSCNGVMVSANISIPTLINEFATTLYEEELCIIRKVRPQDSVLDPNDIKDYYDRNAYDIENGYSLDIDYCLPLSSSYVYNRACVPTIIYNTQQEIEEVVPVDVWTVNPFDLGILFSNYFVESFQATLSSYIIQKSTQYSTVSSLLCLEVYYIEREFYTNSKTLETLQANCPNRPIPSLDTFKELISTVFLINKDNKSLSYSDALGIISECLNETRDKELNVIFGRINYSNIVISIASIVYFSNHDATYASDWDTKNNATQNKCMYECLDAIFSPTTTIIRNNGFKERFVRIDGSHFTNAIASLKAISAINLRNKLTDRDLFLKQLFYNESNVIYLFMTYGLCKSTLNDFQKEVLPSHQTTGEDCSEIIIAESHAPREDTETRIDLSCSYSIPYESWGLDYSNINENADSLKTHCEEEVKSMQKALNIIAQNLISKGATMVENKVTYSDDCISSVTFYIHFIYTIIEDSPSLNY